MIRPARAAQPPVARSLLQDRDDEIDALNAVIHRLQNENDDLHHQLALARSRRALQESA